MQTFTYTLTAGTFTVEKPMGAVLLTVLADSVSQGSFSIVGNIPFNNISPTACVISPGSGVTICAESPASPLDGLTITWIAGNVNIIVGF